MVPITAEDIRSFRAAERVVLSETGGLQTVACHIRSGRRPARRATTHEVNIHRFPGTTSEFGGRPLGRRSVNLNRRQMAAWRRLCSKLRAGDRLSLSWDDGGWPRRRTDVTVLVARAGRLQPYRLGDTDRQSAVHVRPGRVALVLVAAVGLWWLTRHAPPLAAVMVVLLLLGLVVHRRRARDGWPVGTLRLLRFLAFVGITVMPVLLALLVVFGVVYGAVRFVRWARAAWHDWPGGRRVGGRTARHARSWHVGDTGHSTTLDLEPDANGVHRRTASCGSGKANGQVGPIVVANGRDAYDRHVARHVDMAAALHDVVAPGWEQLVDADLLAEAADPGGFILESVFGSYDAGLEAVLGHLKARRRRDATPEERSRAAALEECTRAGLTGDNCTHIGNRPEAVHQRALGVAWCDELARRTHDRTPAS